ncbi:MAG TPA: hypothetical protein VM492_17480 [Sumerlaeia bacterium]|nr:hypothetical protein [Sumerlaeia bacterium]
MRSAGPVREEKEEGLSRKRFLGWCGEAAAFLFAGRRLASAEPQAAPGRADAAGREQERPSFLLKHAGSLDSRIPAPLGIAIDAQDRLYVAGGTGVAVWDAAGKHVRSIESSAPASCVAVDGEGRIYAGLETSIEKYAPSGERLAAWGEKGEKPGQLGIVTGLAVWENTLYIADAGNRKLLRFAIDGDFVDERGDFRVPSPYFDCAVDGKGFLYVGHTARHRVERYNAGGDLVGHWGRPGAAPDCFCGCCNPTNLGVFPDGRVVTTEKGIPRLKVHDESGNLLACLDTEGLARCGIRTGKSTAALTGQGPGCHDRTKGMDLAVDSKSRVALLDPKGGRIHFFELVPNSA